jgi:hypothetical protein
LSWRNEIFYINATDQQLIIHDQKSFREGADDKTRVLREEEIREPYKALINDCLRSNDNEYEFSEVGEFRDGIPFHNSQSENSPANILLSPSGKVKVQDLPDGDYFFCFWAASKLFW